MSRVGLGCLCPLCWLVVMLMLHVSGCRWGLAYAWVRGLVYRVLNFPIQLAAIEGSLETK